MLVRHCMTRRPIAVAPGDACRTVLLMFREQGIRHAPVVEDGRLVGVVSDRDLLRGAPRLVGELEAEVADEASTCTIAEIMSGEPLTCSPNDAIDVVARRIQDLHIGCLPVISDGVLIGVITVTDLLRGFTEHLEGHDLRRVSLIWSPGRPQPAPSIASIATRVGVELVALLSGDTDTGARMHLARTRSSEALHSAFVDACLAAGLLVVGERAAA
jgi:acetoin utilization protein AcuB